MKLLIAAITFAATLGMLFLIETGKSPKEDYARIIEALKEENTNAVVSVTPPPIKSRVQAPAPTSTPILTPVYAPVPTSTPQSGSAARQTSTPVPTQAYTPTQTSSPTPTPTQTPFSQPTSTPSTTPTPTPKQSEKININTANYEELQKITGVGPVIAQRIIDYRNAYGPFQKIEDIKNVSGIKDAKFEVMKDEITVGDVP